MPTPRERHLPGRRVLIEYDALPSTQDVAKAVVREGRAEVVGVRAGFQSAGRGRRGAAWVAPPDTCLLVTYILPGDIADARKVAFGAGLAVCEAVEAVTGLAASVKWPNDVLLEGSKLAGCLIERYACSPGTAEARSAWLVGIGLNANVRSFPPELADSATSLALQLGCDVDVVDVDLDALEAALRPELFQAVARPWPALLRQWRARDATVGRRYVAALPGEEGAAPAEVEGVAVGLSDAGHLLLRLADGRTVEAIAATSAR